MEKIIKELESLKLSNAGFRAGSYNEGINAALHLIKSSLLKTEITELQAWKKIAEETDTDEPTFNPAAFYHDMRLLFKNAKFDVPIRGDQTLYDNGYRIVHESSLPKPVEVPAFVGELIRWVKKNNAVPSDVISDFYSLAVDEINLPDTLELERLSEYFTIACHRFDFEKACVIGYTVVKEPEWIVKTPKNNYFLVFGNDESTLIDSVPFAAIGDKHQARIFMDKTKADAVATLIEGEVVPVKEDAE